MQARPCQQHQVHLSIIQAASQVQDTGGGSYLTRSYAVSQAQIMWTAYTTMWAAHRFLE
jgi:hypothetical protein